jgi:hypothetical protein
MMMMFEPIGCARVDFDSAAVLCAVNDDASVKKICTFVSIEHASRKNLQRASINEREGMELEVKIFPNVAHVFLRYRHSVCVSL